jgi:hypothetical protein
MSATFICKMPLKRNAILIKFFFKSWFSSDVSPSHAIHCFGKCITISWDCDTSLGNQLLKEKKIKKCSIFHVEMVTVIFVIGVT